MIEIVYDGDKFRSSDDLSSFLEDSVGQYPIIHVTCVVPYHGGEHKLIEALCEYLSNIDDRIDVSFNLTLNSNTTSTGEDICVNSADIQLFVNYNCQ